MPLKNSSTKLSGGISPKKKPKEIKEEKTEHIEKIKIEPTPVTLETEENDIYEEPIRQVVIPPNQLRLTEDQLKEEFTRVLTANDPNLPINITKYNYKERVYKIDPPGPDDHVYIHICIDGTALHKESEDAKAQIAYEVKKYEEEKEARELFIRQSAEEAENKGEKLEETTLEQFDMNQKNQFNYSERAAQTFTQPIRSRLVTTEPPPVVSYMGTFTQWEIYDAYMNFYEQNRKEQIQKLAIAHKKEKEQGTTGAASTTGGTTGSGANTSSAATGTSNTQSDSKADSSSSGIALAGRSKEEDMVHSTAMSKSLKILERMVNQNAEDEIFQDFKYWEDISDEYREGEGSLLPLWRFSCERVKKKTVTCVSWNTVFHDLFAVGYGSYDFLKQGSGIICCYTLKNTSHPEYIVALDSGVMSLDFHPQYPVLLAVGCYDGTVMVYDIRNKINKPVYQSTIKTGKHNDPVWQVHWQEEDLTKELNFYSISSDGKVANWVTSKNELKMELVMQLKLVNIPITLSEINNSGSDGGVSESAAAMNIVSDNEETSLSGLASGCCFDFNKSSDHLFLVGTEEGKIHKCSKAYSGQYLETYLGHNMAVYTIKWNAFHPRVFLSCSADWTVKLWDHNNPEPILSFDLGNAVNDIAWSTVSSTVFAAVTSDGKVHVFDLLENKNEPICEQKIVKKAKLTRIVFNKSDPIILVGDDHGGVNCLKLSPNLRKIAKAIDRVGTENGIPSSSTTGGSTTGGSGSGNAAPATTANPNATTGASSAASGTTSTPTVSGDGEVSMVVSKPNIEVEIDKMEKLLSATDNSRISGNNKGNTGAMNKKKNTGAAAGDANESNSRSSNL